MPQAELPPSIISHVSIGTNDYERAKAFYTAVLGTLEVKVMMEHPGAVAFGREFPEFWVGVPHDGGKAHVGNGSHFGFLAASKAQVDAFYAKALEMGGTGRWRAWPAAFVWAGVLRLLCAGPGWAQDRGAVFGCLCGLTFAGLVGPPALPGGPGRLTRVAGDFCLCFCFGPCFGFGGAVFSILLLAAAAAF
jgi:catechol 2,3-dioxygenase-like lactoylglutathione lyase family enzyme